MPEKYYTNYEELPVILSVEEVAKVLGIGKAHAYDLVKTNGFPAFRVGGRICIPKDKFLSWIEAQIPR